MEKICDIAKRKQSFGAERALAAFERSFGVFLTAHDLRGLLRRPDGSPLLPGRHLHPHPCCVRGRYRMPGWGARCYKDCFVESEREAAVSDGPYVKRCWKGLFELVVPVRLEGAHVLTLYAGAFRRRGGLPKSAPKAPFFAKLYASLPELPGGEGLSSLGSALRLLGLGLLASAKEFEESGREAGGRASEIYRFISANAHRGARLKDLASAMRLSPSRAGHLTKELCGKPFQDLLIDERILRARSLLLSSGMGLKEVALATGFKSCHYFNRAFSARHGEPPGRYRRRRLPSTAESPSSRPERPGIS